MMFVIPMVNYFIRANGLIVNFSNRACGFDGLTASAITRTAITFAAETRQEVLMRKSLLVVFVALFASLAFGTGCAKKTPEPETPASYQATQAPAPTAPRPDPVGENSSTDGGPTVSLPHPVQIMVWTDDGLKNVAPGTVIALPKGETMILHLYPQPTDTSALTFSGPLRLARQGGHAVLELVPDTTRGTYDVRVRNGQLPEFPLKVEVR